ncbi:MAG: DUF4383 domain-containing protein [bacterium]|nr:DUF4383 domain-containing protein [bacterium]
MAKKLAVVFGIVFVLVGVLGFIDNPLIGANGYFLTDSILNVVHLFIGIILVIAGRKSEGAAAGAMKIFGIVYLVLFLNGLVTPDALLGFVAQNEHDTWLHLFLGIVLLIAGFTAKGNDAMTMDRASM